MSPFIESKVLMSNNSHVIKIRLWIILKARSVRFCLMGIISCLSI